MSNSKLNFSHLDLYGKDRNYPPLPLAGEGKGEGEHLLPTPTSILPRQGGGSCLVIFMVMGG